MMWKKRGIVCEKKKHYSIFLTDKGEFLRGIPMKEKTDIGDEVEFHQVYWPFLFRRKGKPAFFGAVMIAAMLLFFSVSFLLPNMNTVLAYVQLDTDEAMEFGVDEKGNVVSLRHLKESSSELENSFDKWKGQPLRDVLESAIKDLSTNPSEVQVMITTIFPNDEKKPLVHEIVESVVSDVQKTYKKMTLEVNESTFEDRLTANKQQMSVHEYKKSNQQVPEPELKESSAEVEKEIQIDSNNQKTDQDPIQQKEKQEQISKSKNLEKEQEKKLPPIKQQKNQEFSKQPNKKSDFRNPASENQGENKKPNNSNTTKEKRNNPKKDKAKDSEHPSNKKEQSTNPSAEKNKGNKKKQDSSSKGEENKSSKDKKP
ncbi:anti-sigma factor domain-containing protein [Bacillus sp. FJAT-49732]|uniref:Anti-sigma factor domain-containing protein n=1 Tax=Lederbergia citrisecunda TaxID=2833583 RepID=A0A942YQK5_9BACI|nr:anti-sigma factor domain-containing protein [Lederbergia citrisecunda]MBS4202356.1 anti-sigma factor domain-containing protein [Lederbergia citrisecunda]